MNELEKRAKHHYKHRHGLSPFDYLGESLDNEIMLEYDDLDYTYFSDMDWDGNYDEKSFKIDYSYPISKYEIEEFLSDKNISEEDIENNFEELFEKYESEIKEHFRDAAEQHASENYHYDPQQEYDDYMAQQAEDERYDYMYEEKKKVSYNPNAGNVEKGIEMFNAAQPDGGIGAVTSLGEGLETYHYDGPTYYAGHKISDKEDIYTKAVSAKQARNNILYRLAGGDRFELLKYDIVPENITLIKPEENQKPIEREHCPYCHYELNDMGDCPICDYGEDDLIEENLSSIEALNLLN